MNHRELHEQDLHDDPLEQLQSWLTDASSLSMQEPQAAALATATVHGRPSVRMVLVRRIDVRGLQFFTNRNSRKGQELGANPQAALLFYWDGLQRQVRVEGSVQELSAAESDDYFQSRHRGSQISAWASPQSRVMEHRAELEQLRGESERRFAGQTVPRPPHWGGYLLSPDSFEFWQSRPHRFHDRIRYRAHTKTGQWVKERLAP